MKLSWPKKKCGGCGFDLTTIPPKPTEKGFNAEGLPIWTDFCRCGMGYNVGDREIVAPPRHPEPGAGQEPIVTVTPPIEGVEPEPQDPAAELAEKAAERLEDAAATTEPGNTEEVPPAPPDSEGAAPEEPAEPPEPPTEEPAVVPGGFYFCPKCGANHQKTSKIGKRHLKYVAS